MLITAGHVLVRSGELAEASGHLFNPAVGKLVDLWGFHADEITALAPPDPDAIQALLAATPSAGDVKVEEGYLVSTNPAVQYDMGAFAKGYAIDRGIELLQSLYPTCVVRLFQSQAEGRDFYMVSVPPAE